MSGWPSALDGLWHSITLRSVNFPDRCARHLNLLGELTPIVSDQDRLDSSFYDVVGLHPVPGQAPDQGYVSLRSVNYPFLYLRHQDFRIKLQEPPADGPQAPDGMLFAQDATFIRRPGLIAPNTVSFQSVNYPDRYIRHRDFHLYVEPMSGPPQDFAFTIQPGSFPALQP